MDRLFLYGRRAGRAGEPPEEQHEFGDCLRLARRHWSDRSRRRAGVDRFRLALGSGSGAQGHRDAGSDFRGERDQCIM